MAYIVFSEHRNFSYFDFLHFDVDGKEHGIKHGTFRNKILNLKRDDKIELDYKSNVAFYTLKGHKFGKVITPYHTVVKSDPIYKMFRNLPLDKQCIHDIRLKFKIPGIWRKLSNHESFNKTKRNHDIVIPAWTRDNTIIKSFIHKNDTVSLILGCTLLPIPLDHNGTIRFLTLLVRVEERLQNILDNASMTNSELTRSVPEFKKWIITMWHFGRDSINEYTGEKFSTTIENAQHILTRIYSKEFNGRIKIRFERQEYPHKSVEEIIE